MSFGSLILARKSWFGTVNLELTSKAWSLSMTELPCFMGIWFYLFFDWKTLKNESQWLSFSVLNEQKTEKKILLVQSTKRYNNTQSSNLFSDPLEYGALRLSHVCSIMLIMQHTNGVYESIKQSMLFFSTTLYRKTIFFKNAKFTNSGMFHPEFCFFFSL